MNTMNGVMELAVKRLIRFDGDGSLKAFCDLAVGDHLLIKGVRIVEGKQGLFVTMPRMQGKDARWYDVVELLTPEAKRQVQEAVLAAYHLEGS